MDALLTAIALWLSANYNLPANVDQPKIEFVRPIEISFFRNQAFTAEAQRQVLAMQANANAQDSRREAVAVYELRAEIASCCRMAGPVRRRLKYRLSSTRWSTTSRTGPG